MWYSGDFLSIFMCVSHDFGGFFCGSGSTSLIGRMETVISWESVVEKTLKSSGKVAIFASNCPLWGIGQNCQNYGQNCQIVGQNCQNRQIFGQDCQNYGQSCQRNCHKLSKNGLKIPKLSMINDVSLIFWKLIAKYKSLDLINEKQNCSK